MHPEHSVPLKGTADLQDSLPDSHLAHAEELADVAQAGGHGQLEQGDS